MEYPFITLDDGTQISHSEMFADNCVRVYIVKDMFHRAVCLLPDQSWTEVVGFGEDEMLRYQKVIRKMAPLIIEFSQKGGFRGQCHLVKQMAEEEYLREKMIYGKESHLLFFAARQKDRWTSASK